MHHEIWQIVSVSLKVAFIATLLVMLCSILLAWALVFMRIRILRLLEIAIYVPMAMPPVALGYGLLLMFSQSSWLGQTLHSFGIDVPFSFVGAVIASFVTSLGLGVRTVRVGMEHIDKKQCQIASLMGATEGQIFRAIVFPQCLRAVLGGGILVFVRSLSEFGATMVLAGNSLGSTRTLALAIWVGMETPGKERECLVLVLIAGFIALLALLASEMLLRKPV